MSRPTRQQDIAARIRQMRHERYAAMTSAMGEFDAGQLAERHALQRECGQIGHDAMLRESALGNKIKKCKYCSKLLGTE